MCQKFLEHFSSVNSSESFEMLSLKGGTKEKGMFCKLNVPQTDVRNSVITQDIHV
jgi:hypothetical protein